MSEYDFDNAAESTPDIIDPELIREARCRTRIDVAQTGFNPALGRIPAIETQTVSLHTVLDFVPSWTARRIPIKCIGLTLPEGMEFMPPKVETARTCDGVELKRIGPPRKAKEETDSEDTPRKVTRIRPPSDALSLQDRLFYLLQPPLESWLAEQELIMPFEPFGYQYEGIAWLFASHSALLADEMGLGKTMQTITAIRLLLRSGQARRIVLICPKPSDPELAARIQDLGRRTACRHCGRERASTAHALDNAGDSDPDCELRIHVARHCGNP